MPLVVRPVELLVPPLAAVTPRTLLRPLDKDLVTESVTELVTESLTVSVTELVTDWLTDSLMELLTDSPTEWPMESSMDFTLPLPKLAITDTVMGSDTVMARASTVSIS